MRPGFQRCAKALRRRKPHRHPRRMVVLQGGLGSPGPVDQLNFSAIDGEGLVSLVLPKHQRLPNFPQISAYFCGDSPKLLAPKLQRRHFLFMELVAVPRKLPKSPRWQKDWRLGLGENFGPQGKNATSYHQTFGKSWQIMANGFSIFLAVIMQ